MWPRTTSGDAINVVYYSIRSAELQVRDKLTNGSSEAQGSTDSRGERLLLMSVSLFSNF